MAWLPNGTIACINTTSSAVFIYGQDGIQLHGIDLQGNIPRSVAADSAGNIFVACPVSSTICEIFVNTTSIGRTQPFWNGAMTVSSTGDVYSSEGASISSTTLPATIVSLAIDANNTLYAATTCGIYRITNGTPTLITNTASYTYVSVSPDGAIYCIDTSGNLLQIHSDTTTTILVAASSSYVGTSVVAFSSVLFTSSTTGGIYTVSPNTYDDCFLADAPVLTPNGYVPISSLSEGDMVLTGDGRAVAIQRVSYTRISASPSVNPYIVPKGLYCATVRFLISPNHRISTEKGFIEARRLGLQQENMTGDFDYYNLELPSWLQDTMVVAGVVVESMAPIRRATMTLGEFKKALVAQYGELTPTILAKVQKTCRLVENGRVEFPVLPK